MQRNEPFCHCRKFNEVWHPQAWAAATPSRMSKLLLMTADENYSQHI
jgi:hypothetical protein